MAGISDEHANILEMFSTEVTDDGNVSAVIRPAAVIPEDAARAVLREMAVRDTRLGGHWRAEPTLWRRYDLPWADSETPGASSVVGAIQVAYGTPTRFEITIYRVTINDFAVRNGWTVESLCNEALAFGGLDLDTCPRADLKPPPVPFRIM
jgi:hypothetical protein